MTPVNELGRALVAALSEEDIEALATRLWPHVAARLATIEPRDSEWMDARATASYLGLCGERLLKRRAELMPLPGGNGWLCGYAPRPLRGERNV